MLQVTKQNLKIKIRNNVSIAQLQEGKADTCFNKADIRFTANLIVSTYYNSTPLH